MAELKINSGEHFSLLNLKKKIPYKMKPGRMNNKTGVRSPDMAYIDARQVMDLLDESVGMANWQCEYRDIGGKMYCGIGIRVGMAKLINDLYDKNGMSITMTGETELDGRNRIKQLMNDIDNSWVWKWDMGTESDFEEEKGEASDAFKRAAVKWGIGRFLYDIKDGSKPREDKKESDNMCTRHNQPKAFSQAKNKWYCSECVKEYYAGNK